MSRQLVGAKHDKPDSEKNQPATLAVLFHCKENQKQVDWQPNPHFCYGNHHGVEPIGAKSIKKEKKLGIDVGEKLHFYSSSSSTPLFNMFQIKSLSSTMP